MNRFKEHEVNGIKIRLILTMSVLFEAEDHFGCPFSDILKDGSKTELYERQVWLISRMSYEGYKIYSYEGIKPISMSDIEALAVIDYNKLSDAFWEAYTLGLIQDVQEKEIDLGLLELKKKKKGRSSSGQKSIE